MMRQFKYKVIHTPDKGLPLVGKPSESFADRCENALNKLGSKDWELCGISNTYLIFKKRA